MSATGKAILAVVGSSIVARGPVGRMRWTPAVPAAAVWFPIPTAATAIVWFGAIALARHRAARRRDSAARADVVTLAELSGMGLAAGLDFAGALRWASDAISGEVRADVDGMLRGSRLFGLSAALASDTGRCRRLFHLTARAVDTGAPVRRAVEAFADDAAADERARAISRMRQLPVKLLFPLALLILPGFMILTVGPTLLGSIDRFS